MYISSTSNEKIKFLNTLKKKSVRDEAGLCLLEGVRLVYDSVRFGAEIVSVFYKEGFEGEKIDCKESFILSPKVFDKVAETVNSQGILAVARKKDVDISAEGKNLYILCDGVRDPGNMGTIIRLCHATGAGLLTKDCTDPYSPKCTRASMGGVFAAPPIEFNEEVKNFLESESFTFYGGILSDKSQPLFECNFSKKAVIVVGNEGDGISDEIQSLCQKHILIPMPGGAESLNVSAAAAVMAYEYLRQVM